MKSLINKKTGKAMSCALALAGLAVTAQAQLNVSTVGVLNNNPAAGGGPFIGFVDSPANVGNLSFVTEASMVTIVSAAFSANRGGVVDFETGTGWSTLPAPTNAFSAAYGTSLSQTLTVGLSSPGTLNSFATSAAVPPNYFPSGLNHMGLTVANPTFNFSQGLVNWGIFLLARANNATPRAAQFTFTLADTSTIVFANDTAPQAGPDTWFGVQASDSNPIMSVSINQSGGFNSYDDMAFVVAVPEPTTTALFGMGSLAGFLALRRRRR